jgi:hypothetical protein
MDDELHLGIPGGCEDYDTEGQQIAESDGIPTAIRQRRATTELARFDLGTRHVDVYEGDDGDDADADEKEEVSQADDRLMLTLYDSGYSTSQ